MHVCVSIHVTNVCINVYVLWLHECLLVCMYCMYDYVFYACMHVLVVHYIHIYISERYIILFFILNFSLLATRFSLDWLHRSFSSTRWAAEKGSWTQQWKLQRDRVGCPMYVCMNDLCMYIYVCVNVDVYMAFLSIQVHTVFYARMISNICMHVMLCMYAY